MPDWFNWSFSVPWLTNDKILTLSTSARLTAETQRWFIFTHEQTLHLLASKHTWHPVSMTKRPKKHRRPSKEQGKETSASTLRRFEARTSPLRDQGRKWFPPGAPKPLTVRHHNCFKGFAKRQQTQSKKQNKNKNRRNCKHSTHRRLQRFSAKRALFQETQEAPND